MRCIKCGYDNIEGLKYCSSCGQELLTQEQLAKRQRQNNSKMALRIVLIVLGIAFVACIVSYIIINSNKNKTKEDEKNKTINTELVGVWNCRPYKDAPNYTIELSLNGDRSYIWGTYGKSNLDYTKGTFYSKDMGTFVENENYESYSVTLEATKRATNGVEVDDAYSINYVLALHNEHNNIILASGNSSASNIYCDRKM